MSTAVEVRLSSPLDVEHRQAELVAEPLAWFDSSVVASVALARTVSQERAEEVLETRRQHLRDFEYDQVPEVVDPLSTAARVREAEARFGKEGAEYKWAYESLAVDCTRLLAEARRKLTWEYFPEIEQPFDAQIGYHFKGRPLLDMVSDGLTPIADKEEQGYRVGEYVEETTYGALRQLGQLMLQGTIPDSTKRRPELRVNTISECADWAIEAYNRSQTTEKYTGNFGGYVPAIHKFMIRGVRYDNEKDSRWQEQLGLPGTYITRDIIVKALQIYGVVPEGNIPTKAEVRALQLANLDGKGVLQMAALLDELASQASGLRIFLGEVIAEDQPKDYESVPQRAQERQASLKLSSYELADYLLQLERKGVDRFAALGLVDKFVSTLLFESVKRSPQEAALIYDDNSMLSEIYALNRAYQVGDMDAARRIESSIKEDLPSAAFCGAGSCGLEGVDPGSTEGAELKRLGLKGDTKDDLLHYKKGACPECSAKQVYFDKSGNKACRGCHYRKIDGQVLGGKAAKEKNLTSISIFANLFSIFKSGTRDAA